MAGTIGTFDSPSIPHVKVAPLQPSAFELFSHVGFTLADVNNLWVGPNGVWGSFAAAAIFDLRIYSGLHIFASATAVGGAGGQFFQPLIAFVDNLEGTLANAVAGGVVTPTATIPAGGGKVEIFCGSAAAAVVGGAISPAPCIVPYMPQFARVGMSMGSSPTSITGGRIFVHAWH